MGTMSANKIFQGHKQYAVMTGLLVLVSLIGILSVQHHRSEMSYTASPVHGISFEISSSTESMERGLGGRASIPAKYGMLFVFPQAGSYGFWMKDMLVPIDIIWLSDTGAILKVDASVSPVTYPAVFYPPTPVKYVLEMKAGEAAREGLQVGSTVQLPVLR
jgi:uncharacterized protein